MVYFIVKLNLHFRNIDWIGYLPIKIGTILIACLSDEGILFSTNVEYQDLFSTNVEYQDL